MLLAMSACSTRRHRRKKGEATVQWVSPVGGWRDFALGDFNNDGDLEIVVVGGEFTSGRLAIYDPVVVSGTVEPGNIINQIPWAELYSTSLSGRPLLVGAGDLNPALPGDELAFITELDAATRTNPDDESRLALWQADLESETTEPAGRRWTELSPHVDFTNTWKRLALGDPRR